ncbi:helix-turn-helix transcriptional regulator [Pedobacter sp. PLR]|uniref:helix-turn-helix domain-containing protein n=1 Tax=Pedobacter sp. PLR TaxID=2994465 RepID=UPI0022466B6E|nr:helix-turn-helix transcriptional regulator [Pedobacter sp. PLR]MCX2454336.1 helix-turn-helix transcriptional regulator [Pedobacter sp. PLR]
MSSTTDRPNKAHEGRNIKRFREMMGIKQEGLAASLGEEWSQKKISVLESREKIDEGLLEKIAGILNVPEAAIRNFDEETAIYNIQNNYEGSSSNYSGLHQCTFNPLDKLIETVDELKKLHAEKDALYERLLNCRGVDKYDELEY